MKAGISFSFITLVSAFILLGCSLLIWPDFAGVETFAFVMTGWIVSVCLHEFSHAITASTFGDSTIRDRGYLRLDPRSYIHWNASFVLPLLVLVMGGVALPGAAVLIRNDLITRRWQRSAVALAGPFMTLLVAMASYALGVMFDLREDNLLSQALMLLAFFQLMAFVFNIMPVPGLDGFAALTPWLPTKISQSLRRVGNIGWLRLAAFALFFFFGYRVIYPIMGAIVHMFGINLSPAFEGYDRFRFWS